MAEQVTIKRTSLAARPVTDAADAIEGGQASSSSSSSSSLAIQEVRGPDRNSIVGALCSAVVHMALIIALGLLFSTVHQDGAMEIKMAVANTSSSESFETLSVEIEQPVAAPADSAALSAATTTVEIAIEEPTLVTDFSEKQSSQSIDALANLSDAIEPPGGRASGEKSSERGSFFGANAYGDEFVYVVDMSTSMGYTSQYGQTRFRVACRELLRSIKELKTNQKFCVFMFCYRTRVMFDMPPRMISATPSNKQRLATWISKLKLGAGTDPRYGTVMALKLKPDAIFLLSDGEFNGQQVNTHGIPGNVPIETLIRKYRKDSVPIHTIAFEDMLNRTRLRRIAGYTVGTHRFVGNVSDQQLLAQDLASDNMADVAYGLQNLIDGKQKVRDDQHLRIVTRLVAKHFTHRKPKFREKAREAMLVLADGEDLGPSGDDPSKDDYDDAKKEWLRYWTEHFREERAHRRGDAKELEDGVEDIESIL